MELIRNSDKKLIVTHFIATAYKDKENKEEACEFRTMINHSPVVVFPDGDMVVISWVDIYNIAKAKKYENSEVQNESNKDVNN